MTQKLQTAYVHCSDPFRPALNRKVENLRPGMRLDTLLRQKGHVSGRGNSLQRKSAFIVLRNGKAVLQEQWSQRIRRGDIITVSALPKGGGGSNPLQALMSILVVVAAIYAPFALGLTAGTWQAAAVSAGIMLAGTTLVSLMFPPPTPSSIDTTREQASPNYTISSQGNQARLLEAIPVQYGRFRTYPDLASQPYTENRGNSQYLYQLFCISQGEIDVEAIRIEENAIGDFPDVQYQLVQPYQSVTLFPDNVVTSAAVNNLEMLAPNEPNASYLGPFVANPSGTQANFLAVDVSLPRGIYQMNDKGKIIPNTTQFQFEYRLIDDSGNPQGVWTKFIDETITAGTLDPQQYTFKVEVPMGRYQVRGVRINPMGDASRSGSMTVWAALRAYLPSQRNYGNVTMLAVVMRATNVLNQNIARRVNVIATRKLPVWDPVNGWSVSAVPTRNPAWAFCDALRNTTYGRSWPTSAINMSEVYRLSQVWAARGDSFDGVFDTTTQLWDAVTKIARVGRAAPMYYAGVVDIVRNEPKTLPTQMFSPANILEGSFSSEYSFSEPGTPDHVVVEYVDDVTWAPATVTCVLPGNTAENPANVVLFGCTNRDQAWREGMSMAAANRDQRRLIALTTEMEGHLPRFGDLCQISHDVTQWGYSGRVESFERGVVVGGVTRNILTTTEPLPFDVAGTFSIAFRRRDGTADGPYTVQPTPTREPNKCYVLGATGAINNIYISDGLREEFTHYQFGPTTRRGLLALARSAQPNEKGEVAMTFVNYAQSVHSAENGGVVPPPDPSSNLPRPPIAPIIDQVTLEMTPTVGVQNIVATPANGASYYEFAISSDGFTWSSLGTSADPYKAVSLTPGAWYVRVRAVGRAVGPWTTWYGNVEATTLPLPTIDAFSFDKLIGAIRLNWAYSANNVGMEAQVEIWQGISNVLGNASRIATLPYPISTYVVEGLGPGQELYYWIRIIDTAGRAGPWWNSAIGMLATSEDDPAILLEYLSESITSSQLAQELLEEIESGGGAAVEITEIKNDLAAMYTIKTQLSAGGRTYLAGIGVGVENNDGIIESQVLIAASRFAIIDPNDVSGTPKVPFVVVEGVTYINEAFIRDATITNAKIANLAVTNAKIADLSVTNAKIADLAVTNAKIANLSVTNAKIGVAEVDTLRIAGSSVTVGTGQAWNYNIGSRSGSGQNSFSHSVYTPYGGQLLYFVTSKCTNGGTHSFNHNNTITTSADGVVYNQYVPLGSGTEPDVINAYNFSFLFVGGSVGGGTGHTITVNFDRPSSGNIIGSIRIAVLVFQR